MSETNPAVHRDLRDGAKGADVRELQQTLDAMADQLAQLDKRHIKVDGEMGPASRQSAHRAAWLLGEPESVLKEIAGPGGKVKKIVQRHIRNPGQRSDTQKKRAAKRREWAQKNLHNDPPQDADHFTSFDGKLIPEWIGADLQKVRSAGRWKGYLNSGYRTPEYSESLCYGICGHPSCPGTCAGRSSNHCCPPTFTGVYHEGACDVTDYTTFGAECSRLGVELRNNLPADPVHFSYTGG